MAKSFTVLRPAWLSLPALISFTFAGLLKGGPLDLARAANFFGQLVKALDAIHANGICHRDVKPENIVIRNQKSDELVLIDFSFAIVKKADETLHGLSRAAVRGTDHERLS